LNAHPSALAVVPSSSRRARACTQTSVAPADSRILFTAPGVSAAIASAPIVARASRRGVAVCRVPGSRARARAFARVYFLASFI
jgi:hypothetical protein